MKRFVLTFSCSDSFVEETLDDAKSAFFEQIREMHFGEIMGLIEVESESEVPETLEEEE